MREKNTLVISEAVSILVTKIGEYGVTVREGVDMSEFDQMAVTLPGKRLSDQVRKENFDRTPANWLWLCAFDANDRCISTQAARRDQLGSMSLADFISQQHWRLHVHMPMSSAVLQHRHADATYRISGEVSHQMDMELCNATGRGKYRDGKFAGLLATLFQLIIYNNWNPDCTYCFMSERLVKSGFAARSGFNHIQHLAIDWEKSPEDVNGDDCIAYSFREDLEALPYEIVGRAARALLQKPARSS